MPEHIPQTCPLGVFSNLVTRVMIHSVYVCQLSCESSSNSVNIDCDVSYHMKTSSPELTDFIVLEERSMG